MAMITILGTSHVSPESLHALKKTIRRKDCVCVELDPIRYYAMINKESKRPPGLFPKILHYVQQKLGRSTGVLPGEDMLTAINVARENSVPVYLIDEDIRVTLAKLKKVPAIEKLNLIVPLFVGPMKLDLQKVPSKTLVNRALGELHKKAPKMYSVLVDERNAYMAAWITRLSDKHKNILIVVGAAHTKGLEKILKAEGHKVRVL